MIYGHLFTVDTGNSDLNFDLHSTDLPFHCYNIARQIFLKDQNQLLYHESLLLLKPGTYITQKATRIKAYKHFAV